MGENILGCYVGIDFCGLGAAVDEHCLYDMTSPDSNLKTSLVKVNKFKKTIE